jgi:hypothetical protein
MAAPAPWQWPDSLDAIIAAPEYHTVLFENEKVRVIDTHIPVGHTVPLHTHRWPGVYYTIVFGDFIRRDSAGQEQFDSRTVPGFGTPGTVHWLDALPPHSVENVSSSAIHIVSVELKSS